MDGSSILGQGNFAIVVGPFMRDSIIKLNLFVEPKTNGLFIIKIYKNHPTETYHKLIDKQNLYTKLTKQSRHNSVLFPLATSFVWGKDIIHIFPYMRQHIDKKYFYQLELEEYGGLSLDNFIYSKGQPVFTNKQFLKIWRCVPDILEDAYYILFDNHLIMTDIKTENMVLSSNYTLRLIDVDINPNTRTLRINTPYIMNLPVQYFNRRWWHPYDQDKRKHLWDLYKHNYKKHLKDEKEIIRSILKFIHSYKDPYTLIQKQGGDDNKFQRLFFVMHPLFMMILVLIANKCVGYNKEEKPRVKKIVAFCLDILRKRGRFNNKFNHHAFQHFIWKLKSL